MTLPECNLPVCPEPDPHRIETGRCMVVMPAPATTPDPVTDVWELLWTAACDYRDANPPPHNSTARLIDALMPVVRQYAAGELLAIARKAMSETPGAQPVMVPTAVLFDRAHALGGVR